MSCKCRVSNHYERCYDNLRHDIVTLPGHDERPRGPVREVVPLIDPRLTEKITIANVPMKNLLLTMGEDDDESSPEPPGRRCAQHFAWAYPKSRE